MSENIWNHKWFGFWREFGFEYSKCPSIYNWIYPNEDNYYGKELPRILHYLRTGISISTTSAVAFPNPFNEQYQCGATSIRTDGVWIWLDLLADYMERNNVYIPESFYCHIKGNSFTLPDVLSVNPKNLDWNGIE